VDSRFFKQDLLLVKRKLIRCSIISASYRMLITL